DPSTVPSQIAKLRDRFGGGDLTLVGDRGMLKYPQQQALQAEGMHHLTAITPTQIRSLVRRGLIQLDLFDQDVTEITDPETQFRYVLRRNPLQAQRMRDRRADQWRHLQQEAERWNAYLADHPRARVATAVRRLEARLLRYKFQSFVTVQSEDRHLTLVDDPEALAQVAQLDGCDVLQTDLPVERASAATLDARYRDLARVERIFRTAKTAHLELRPIYLRNE